jgi:outer membrane protein OmpA-like peptidoglycan-associated protein/tetratricopeptide (TPR) repeat protein
MFSQKLHFATLFIIFLLSFFSHGVLQAQTTKRNTYFIEGEQFFKEKKYANALTKFELAIEADKTNTEAFYYAAICYSYLGIPESAFEYLKSIEVSKISKFKDYDYWYAQTAYQFADFVVAQEYISRYLKGLGVKKYQKEAQELNKLCEIAKFAKDSLTQRFVVEPFNEQINSSASEFGIIVTKDCKRIFFNRQNQDFNLKDEIKKQEKARIIQLFASDIGKNDLWTSPFLQINAPQKDNAEHTQKICQLIEDNKKMLVCQQGDLKIVEWTGNDWKVSADLEGINTSKSPNCGFIYANQAQIIFSAETANGDLDLFSAQLREGKWENIQAILTLNSPLDETTPFVSNDGKVLFFSSRGHDSMGGYDVFKSVFDSLNNQWSKPINLGLPINSVADDGNFSLFGDLGFFVSDRIGGMGGSDLYRVYAFDKVRMSGKVYNRTSNQVVPNCLLKFVIDGKIIESVSEENGNYKVDLPFHKPLEVKVYSGERIMYEENLKLNINPRRPRYLNRNYYIDDAVLTSTNGSSPSYLSGAVKDKKTQKMLSAVVKLIDVSTNKVLKATSTDLNGRFNFFLTEKAEKYIIEANSKGYIYESIDVKISGGEPNPKADLALSIIEPNARFTLRNITFETNSDVLQISSLTELDKVFDFMTENSKIKVEISGHTDNVGNEGFNMELSERRAASVVRYLTGKGVSTNRITAKGYGSTRPVSSNDFEKGGRELNRRIEVMIVE